VVISGCGDIGVRVAQRWQAKGTRVVALSRRPEKAKQLQSLGIEALQGDLDDPASLKDLALQGVLLYHFAPPPAEGDSDPRLHNLLNAITPDQLPAAIVLISTTAVYGDCNGGWVNEQSPTHPQTARGRRRLDAEQALRHWSHDHQVPSVILRVPGIYAPERLPLERIKSGAPILREEQSPFTNRIHADDLAMVCVMAAEKAADVAGLEQQYESAIYNVSDGHPGTMSQYFKDIADALGLPRPVEIGRDEAEKVMSPGMLSYLRESRRIDNSKMLKELGVVLQYPDLNAGLSDVKKNKSG